MTLSRPILPPVAALALALALGLGCASRSKPGGSGDEVPQAYQDPVTVACNPAEATLDGSGDEGARAASPEAGLSPPQMVATSKTLLEHMGKLLHRITAARQVARNRNDVVRLGCVNDRMLEAKKLLNVAERSHDYLIDAISTDNSDERDRHYYQITGAYQSLWILGDEASECACQGLEPGKSAAR